MTELPDRLLRDALDDTASATPSPACLDAARLAAWADGTLTRAERASLETHAAACARCLALLAAMTRTEPLRRETPWWRTPFVWLPLATVTAALVIVVRLAVTEPQSSVRPTVASPDAANRSAPAAATPAAAPVPAVAPTSPAAREKESSAIGRPRSVLAPAPTREPAAAAPASPPPPAAQLARDAASVPSPQPMTAATPAPPAPPSAVRDEVVRSQSGTASSFAGPSAMKVAGAAPAPVVIASPDRESQWRVVAGRVEHTTDGGATWQSQSMGVATPLRAGAAPDARVCWLVGAAGVVLRTIDGATWMRLPFPEPADLVAVQAGDATQATVVTADGRRFATRDGGTTWTPQ